jgi:hypothetical protein
MFDEKDIDNLIIDGYLEVDSLDSVSGEFLYKFTPKMFEEHPDLQSIIQESFLKHIIGLWDKGFVSMDIDRPEPVVKLTEKAFEESSVAELDADQRTALNVIMRSMQE